jgi:hypothetical protein
MQICCVDYHIHLQNILVPDMGAHKLYNFSQCYSDSSGFSEFPYEFCDCLLGFWRKELTILLLNTVRTTCLDSTWMGSCVSVHD